jgi:hypothetical protein
VGVASVELDGDLLVSPEAVDDVGRAVDGQRDVRLRLLQTAGPAQLGEAVLELAADDLAGVVLCDCALQRGDSLAAVGSFNGGIEGGQVQEALVLGFPQCS